MSVAYIEPKSRTERPRKTKIGTGLAHVTRDSDTTFKVKGQRSPWASLLTAALTRQAAAAVSMHGNVWAWKTTAMLRLYGVLGGARGARAPTGEERGGAYCVATRTACYYYVPSPNRRGH